MGARIDELENDDRHFSIADISGDVRKYYGDDYVEKLKGEVKPDAPASKLHPNAPTKTWQIIGIVVSIVLFLLGLYLK